MEKYKLKKVAIIDFDVHHGNGTQDIFYDNEKVLYISSHQYPYYPGSGATNEKGTKDNWSHDIGSCTSPKYGEFVVYGNFIVLCQGFEEKVALSRCNDLLSKLE